MLSPLRNRAGTRLREPFGKAGLTVAAIALVFAMLGGAYAASNDGGGKATASAKKGPPGPRGKTGKPGPAGPAGPAGAQGPAGAAGATGDTGAKGDTGITGSAGTAGKNAEAIPFSGSKGPIGGVTCTEGGLEVKSASATTLVCNGTKGTNGTNGTTGFTETLPPGKTETGTYAGYGRPAVIRPETEEEEVVGGVEAAITLPIPLSAPISGAEKIKRIEPGNTVPSECDGGSPAEPKAAAGYLCVYNSPFSASSIGQVISPAGGFEEVGVSGAWILGNSESYFAGSYAVTGCGGTEFPCP